MKFPRKLETSQMDALNAAKATRRGIVKGRGEGTNNKKKGKFKQYDLVILNDCGLLVLKDTENYNVFRITPKGRKQVGNVVTE